MSYTQMNLPRRNVRFYPHNQEQVRVLLCGLNGAGKTTILRVIQHGEIVATTQSNGVNFETVVVDNNAMRARHAGGRCPIRPLWQRQYENVKSLIFIVDSNDRNSVMEARDELHRITNEPELKYKPVLILANKQDFLSTMTLDELREELALADFDANTKWHLQATCALQNKGIKEGFEWLANIFVTKNNFLRPIFEIINDSMMMMKNTYLSGFSQTNFVQSLNPFVQL